MDIAQFESKRAGQLIKTPLGYWTFLPNPLPPEIRYGPRLVAELSRADRALGMLAGAAERLPNPDLLVLPYMRREAILSSRIEGTETSMTDLLFFEAGESEPSKRADILEVQNYLTAMSHGLARQLMHPPSCTNGPPRERFSPDS
ncbi:MAG: Fic/DOC family N-terminal domain-containing protein [Pseudomonadota bacterium]